MRTIDVYNAVCALLNTKPVFIGATDEDDEVNPVLADANRLRERERFLGIYGIACRILHPVYLAFCKYTEKNPQALPERAPRFSDLVFYPDSFIPALCTLCAYLTEYRTEHKMLYEEEVHTIFGGLDPSIESISDIYGNI